jgi:diguanylate cyclase (GGDEF)-like protein
MNEAVAPFTRVAAPVTAAEPAPCEPVSSADALRDALFDSRQRWRELVTLAADFVFETDARGRLAFVAPDPALGWAAGTLLGQPAELLLADSGDGTAFNPFRITASVRRRRVWLRRPDGRSLCLAIAAAPVLDAAGAMVGVRGLGQDVSEQDGHDARIAAALRRGELLDHILWHMRQEVLAEKMMKAALDALVAALGADGCAVIDMLGDGVESSVLYRVGTLTPDMLHTAMTLLEASETEPAQASDPEGRGILVCPSQQRYGEQAGFALWRPPGGRAWDADELVLAGSATGVIRVILEHEAIQREMARQARTDPLTGLLNRRAFLDEVSRRIDRLEREELPGTLMFVDLDNFKSLNDCRGHDVGDEALCLTAGLLRQTVRPSDLVARLGGDEFAVWMDGADELTSAERAESLRVEGPRMLAHLKEGYELSLTMSIGIAARWPGQGEDIEALIHRADQAMYEVKRAGRGHWRVSRSERV